MKTPRIATVYISRAENELRVVTEWAGVDRPVVHIFSLPATKISLAGRLVAAIKAGAIFIDPQVMVDVRGQTYVSHGITVIGRTMDADLKRLGF